MLQLSLRTLGGTAFSQGCQRTGRRAITSAQARATERRPAGAARRGSSVRHDETDFCRAACAAPPDDRRGARDRWPRSRCRRARDAHRSSSSSTASRSRSFDIEQRTKLIQLTTQKTPPRQEVLDELINEKLKVQLLQALSTSTASTRKSTTPTPTWRGACGTTPKQFTDRSRKQGVKAETLKARIQADLDLDPDHPRQVPEQLPGRRQGRRSASSQAKKPDDANAVGYDYTLAPDPVRGAARSPPAAFEARSEGSRGAARPLPELRRGHRAGPRHALRGGARSRWSKLRRPAAGAARRAGRRPSSAS